MLAQIIRMFGRRLAGKIGWRSIEGMVQHGQAVTGQVAEAGRDALTPREQLV